MKKNIFLIQKESNEKIVFNFQVKAYSVSEAIAIVESYLSIQKVKPEYDDGSLLGDHFLMVTKIKRKNRGSISFAKKIKLKKISKNKVNNFKIVYNGCDGRMPDQDIEYFYAESKQEAEAYCKSKYSNWESVRSL